MHELSVAQEIVDMLLEVSKDHGGARVLKAGLLVGDMSCLEPETLRFAFDVCCRGNAAEGCRLEIERVQALLRCVHCGSEAAEDLFDLCPGCGRVGYEIVRGREIRLDWVDLDDGVAVDQAEAAPAQAQRG